MNDPEMAEALGITRAIRTIGWDRLGKRVIALYALYGFGIASTGMLLLLTVQHLTPKRFIGCGSVFVAWGMLIGTRTIVDDWRSFREVSRLFAKFEQAGLALNNKWPTEPGEVPPGIRYYISAERYPDVLMLRGRREPYPFHEDFGLMINRGFGGTIRFDLAAAVESCVEYHPNGSEPTAHRGGFGYPSPPVAAVTKLKDNWYLVRYGS